MSVINMQDKDTYYCVFEEKLLPIPKNDLDAFNLIKGIHPKKRNKTQKIFWIKYFKLYKSIPKDPRTRRIFKPGMVLTDFDYPYYTFSRYMMYLYVIANGELLFPET
jgi:hypothetical protein